MTNIMTAKNASKMPDIIGKWVVFPCDGEFETHKITEIRENGNIICKYNQTKLIIDSSEIVAILDPKDYVSKRGPLGGELKRLGDCAENERIYLSARASQNGTSITCDSPIDHNLLVETNIPPRPAFTPMTAGEAAKLPGIVGRWVAVQVDEARDGVYQEDQWINSGDSRFYDQDQILLIEGVDL